MTLIRVGVWFHARLRIPKASHFPIAARLSLGLRKLGYYARLNNHERVIHAKVILSKAKIFASFACGAVAGIIQKMEIKDLHPWDIAIPEAMELQRRLARQVLCHRDDGELDEPRLVAGVDLSAEDSDGFATGAAVLLCYPGLEIEEVATARAKVSFPYVPGLLSFRESPVVLSALEKLTQTPDLILVDGQGLAHPRRFGIACHIGLAAGVPTIGCAKSILCGKHGLLSVGAGATAPLVDNGEVVGAAVRTKAGISPVYISIGHKVDLATAVRWCLAVCKGYRLPEPTRLAHLAAAGSLKGLGKVAYVSPGRQVQGQLL